ncbi:MAG TPA: CBS domain-containing protein [Noviherbaspirillum sp.]
MKTVSQILHAKGGTEVHTISPGETVLEAIRRMAEHGIGALVVMEGGAIVGMVTERDYARKVILMGRNSDQTAVREIMSPTVLYVRPQQSNEDCMALMANSRVRHLPVMEGGRLIGLISMGDLVKDIISDQQFTIEQLEHYISGQHA